MRWTDDHDQAFVREILLEPFKYPNSSTEKGQALQ